MTKRKTASVKRKRREGPVYGPVYAPAHANFLSKAPEGPGAKLPVK